jgi:hypothetical protein
VITGIVGGLGFAFHQPWLFPSLGPTIFIHTMTPHQKAARPWNTFVGHGIGVAAAFVSLGLCGALHAPSAMIGNHVTPQFLGGVAAAAFLRAMFGTIGLIGATIPGPSVSEFKALVMEILLSTGLVSTILGTASGARNVGSNGALAIGGYIALAGLWAAPISGASMNPVRSFAPDLIRGDLGTTWIYIAGPVLGALIAVGFEWMLKGKATAAGSLAARGNTNMQSPYSHDEAANRQAD